MASTFSSSSSSYNRPNARKQRMRATSEQVRQMRSTAANHKECAVTKFAATWTEGLKNTFAALCAPRVKNVNAMCENYGHVIDGSWKGHTPKCLDCGTPVTAPEMLRKAAPNPAVAKQVKQAATR